ncbi:MAG: hypothetical protein ABII08_03385 [Candidatus Beckwithbacteria bacterium]
MQNMQNTSSVQNQTQPTPTPQPTNTPPDTQTPPPTLKKKKPWLLISLVVLLLSATGVLGYKYYEVKQQLNKQQSALSSTPVSNEIFSEPESDESLITSSEAIYELKKLGADKKLILAIEDFVKNASELRRIIDVKQAYFYPEVKKIYIFDGSFDEEHKSKFLFAVPSGFILLEEDNTYACADSGITQTSNEFVDHSLKNVIFSTCINIYLINPESRERIMIEDPNKILSPETNIPTVNGGLEFFDIAGRDVLRIVLTGPFRTGEVIIDANTGEILKYIDFRDLDN